MKRFLALFALLSVVLVPHADADEPTLPNLRPDKPYDIQLGYADEFNINNPTEALRFSMASGNVGAYALDLLGAPPKDQERTTANQCVAWVEKVCTQRQEAGEFVFHPLHGHWHLDSFAAYELRKVTRKGAVDMTGTGLVATSGKVSFCMMDSQPVGGYDPNQTQTGFYNTCTGVYQGISAGWADVYDFSLPGQQIVVKDIPDGTYALVVKSNVDGQLLETDYTDNTAYEIITLATPPGCVGRTVTVGAA
ncbi:MAG TPA: lysyl oxidase family protein [Acidimicrobiales bacterium]|nr:lysyl oxidase family protein [Acidimicrobiales bacterium]